MRLAALLLAMAPALAGQPLSGAYHFYRLSVGAKDGVKIEWLAGAINPDSTGSFSCSANPFFTSACQATVNPMADSVDIVGGRLNVRARYNQGMTVLAGSSRDTDEFSHDLFVALKAPANADASLLRGDYAGGYFRFRDLKAAGIATGFVRFTADGQGGIASAKLIGHSEAVDDVERSEELAPSTYSLETDGTGKLRFNGFSDVADADHSIFVSPDGGWVLGYCADGLFIAVRRQPDIATFALSGLYWLAELHAENGFVYSPESVKIASAAGWLRADGGGGATVAESVRSNGRRINLTTQNRYFVTTGGMASLARQQSPKVDNLSIAANGEGFVGAFVGSQDDLTLEHGLFIGLRAAVPTEDVVLYPSAPVAAGAVISLFGSNLAPATVTAPESGPVTELSGISVTFNGIPAGLLRVSPTQIDLQAPSLTGTIAQVAVNNNGRTSRIIEVELAASSPTFVGVPTSPLRPGDTAIFLITGLSPSDPMLRIYFSGVTGEITFADALPGLVGVFRVDATVPELDGLAPVPVGVATTDAYTDLATITVSR